jgi:hypothetical protein
MATKKGNSYIQITLPEFHSRKLQLICAKTGLTKSGVLQRLIENYKMDMPRENVPLGTDPTK